MVIVIYVRDEATRKAEAFVRRLCASGDLRALRCSGGLTLKDMAEMVSAECGYPVAASVVSRWERGVTLPGTRRARALFAVAEALSADMEAY